MAKTGAARVFFDVVGRLQSTRLLADSKAAMTVQQAIMMDAMGAVQDSFTDMTGAMSGALNTVVEAFFEYEQQLVRVRKFYGDGPEMEAFAESAREMGLAFAFTGGEALQAAARTAQLKGVLKSQQAIIEATRQGLLLAQIGEMETEMGMNRFINLAQQTAFMYGGLTKAQYEALDAEQQANIVRESSIHTLNQLNTIENSSVATMEDITFVLNQFASQADIAGESIGDMAAMSALLLETGEEVSRAGTGLRMIYQRLGNANNEATKAIAELIPELDAQGVAQLKLSDVIQKLAPAYGEMDSAQKRSLAVSVAGSRHYIKFLKIMENQTRLTELQTAAFEGQYGALEEFDNKAKSAVFQAQQMEAALENMRQKIGEDLTEAYMTAYRAEEKFLNMAGFLLKSERVQEAVGGIMAVAGTYDKIFSPIGDVLFMVGNIIISMKTLSAVTNVNSAAMQEQVRTYQEAALIMRLQNGFEKELIATGEHRLSLMNRQQQSRLTLAALARKDASVELERLNNNKKLAQSEKRKISRQLASLSSGKKDMAQKRALTGQMKKQDAILRKLGGAEGSIAKQRTEVRKLVYVQQQEASLQKTLTSQKAGRMAMEKRSIEQIYKTVEAQKSQNQLLQTQSELMQQEVVLYQALSVEVKEGLVAKNSELAHAQREQQDILAGLRLREAERMSKGLNVDATREDIATTQQKIQTIAEERIAIQSLITADKTYRVSTKTTDAAQKGFIVSLKATTAQLYATGAAMKTVNAAFMGTAMILPMIVEQEDQMAAAMYGMALVGMTAAVPALKAIFVSTMEVAGATALASGGLTLLIGALSILAAYAGFEYIFKPLFGDKLKSDLLDIQNINHELNDTVSILSDLSGAAGDTPILNGLYGETTFNDLKQNAELTGTTLEDLQSRLATMREEKITATGLGDTELAAGLQASINLLTKAEQQILAIEEAQKIVATGPLMKDTNSLSVGFDEHDMGKFMDAAELADVLGLMDLNEYKVTGTLAGEEFVQYFGEGAEGKAAAEAFVAEYMEATSSMLSDESSTFMNEYYTSLLAVQSDANSQFVSEEQELYNTITQQQEAFANAREELFFGERQNFTGALYKQVVQGGVESLLHKTEIVQHNVFNGYNTEQMVDRVTRGVLDELRAQGVGA